MVNLSYSEMEAGGLDGQMDGRSADRQSRGIEAGTSGTSALPVTPGTAGTRGESEVSVILSKARNLLYNGHHAELDAVVNEELLKEAVKAGHLDLLQYILVTNSS